jgi:hypothetical protein
MLETKPEFTFDLDIATVSDDGLLEHYENALAWVEHYQRAAGHIEQEIYQRLNERGGTMMPSEEYVCEIQTKNTYLQDAFRPLKEVFSEAELATVLTPAHQELVDLEDKWNTQKLIALAKKYGDQALRIVEYAKVPGPQKLRFERKR